MIVINELIMTLLRRILFWSFRVTEFCRLWRKRTSVQTSNGSEVDLTLTRTQVQHNPRPHVVYKSKFLVFDGYRVRSVSAGVLPVHLYVVQRVPCNTFVSGGGWSVTGLLPYTGSGCSHVVPLYYKDEVTLLDFSVYRLLYLHIKSVSSFSSQTLLLY